MRSRSGAAERTRRQAEPAASDVIWFDPTALEASATRTDAGDDAVVSRAFLADVWAAIREPGRIRLLPPGQAPTPMVTA